MALYNFTDSKGLDLAFRGGPFCRRTTVSLNTLDVAFKASPFAGVSIAAAVVNYVKDITEEVTWQVEVQDVFKTLHDVTESFENTDVVTGDNSITEVGVLESSESVDTNDAYFRYTTLDVSELSESADTLQLAASAVITVYEIGESTDFVHFPDVYITVDIVEYITCNVLHEGTREKWETVLESLNLYDSFINSYLIFISESAALNDSTIPIHGMSLLDSIAFLVNLDIKWTGTKTLTDTFSVYENLGLQFIKTITEALSLTDSSSVILEIFLTEFITLTESIIANWNTTRTVTDGLMISDASVVQLQLSVTEALALTDAQVLSLQLILTDFFFSSDNTVPNWNTIRTVTDYISLVDSFTEALQLLIIESLDLTDVQSAQLQLTLSEFISASENITPNWNTTRVLTDSINIIDLLYQQLSLFLSESLVVTDFSPLSQLGLSIYEYLGFTELLFSPGVFLNSVQDELNILDNLSLCYSHIVSDVLSLVSAADTVRLLINTVSESVGLSETAVSRINSVLPISESLVLLDVVTSTGVLYNTIQDALILNLVIELGDEIWECYVLNTPKFLPSIYSGFNFNSYAVFDNRAYGCKSDGVYELSGTTDNGVVISTGVQLSNTRFGIPNQKHFRKAYIGVIGSTPYLSTETEDGEIKTYSIDADGEVDMTRALRSKKWKLTLTNFSQLDFIKLIPVVLAK